MAGRVRSAPPDGSLDLGREAKRPALGVPCASGREVIYRTARMGLSPRRWRRSITTSSVKFFASRTRVTRLVCVRCAGELRWRSPDSYIYQKRGSAGCLHPLRRCSLRPEATQNDLHFSSIGSGSAASNRRALPNSYDARALAYERADQYRQEERDEHLRSGHHPGGRYGLHWQRLQVRQVGKWRAAVNQSFLAGYNMSSGDWFVPSADLQRSD